MANVLVLNAGSSSLKFAVVDPASGARAMLGIAQRLGTDEATFDIAVGAETAPTARLDEGSHRAAVAAIVEHADALDAAVRPVGVGHRVVHGGDEFSASVVIDDDVLAAVTRFSPLAPLHNPPALLGIEAVSAHWPGLPQVAVFDTAFHQTMPQHAYRYAVPREWYDDHHVRRYGFHGTSHRYVSGRAAEVLGVDPADLNVVVCHLGNGCSAAAVRGGVSVDTTMGLTPLEGLVMGTRSGDVDPGLFDYLGSVAGLSAAEVTGALNTRSGLLGLSGRSNDMRTVESAADDGDERARLALEVFAYRLAKAVSGLVVALGRLDALVFTGGIGENSPGVRARVVAALGFLGLRLDPDANAAAPRGRSIDVAAPGSPAVLVIPTDEELMIALDTARLVGGGR